MTYNTGPQRTEPDNLRLPNNETMGSAFQRFANDVQSGAVGGDVNSLIEEYKREKQGVPDGTQLLNALKQMQSSGASAKDINPQMLSQIIDFIQSKKAGGM